LSIDTIWPVLVSVVVLVVWFGFLASVVWQVWHEYDREHGPPLEGDKPPAWTRFEGWVVGLGTAFVAVVALDRLTGGTDTQFFNGIIGLVGTVAVLGWLLTAFGAFGILAWRLVLFVRTRWRAARRS
jgi:hypothetical protein